MMSGLHRVFVYGTLKRGQPNHHVLQEARGIARLLGEARLTHRYPLILTHYGIPMLLAKPGTGEEVEGELYEVDDDVLAKLDEIEEHPTLYTRTPTHCHLLTPSPQSHPSPSPSSPTPSNPTTSVECETYLVFDFTDAALQLPHHSSYDVNNLPQGMEAPPSAEDRSAELATAIYQSLFSIKRQK